MTEDALQKQVIAWLSWQYSHAVCWHTPNGGSRHVAEACKLKAMGTRPGVADLAFIIGAGQAAFIELKVGKNTTTAHQDAFRDMVKGAGCQYHVARSLSEVELILNTWRDGGLIDAKGAPRTKPEAAPEHPCDDLIAVGVELLQCSAYWSEYDVSLCIAKKLRDAVAKAIGEVKGGHG